MALRPLLDFLFPPQCMSCNALSSGFCDLCARSATTIVVRLPSLRVTAFGSYEGPLRAAILGLKDGRRDVAEALARAVAPLVTSGSVLIPVPTTAKRRRVRGLDGVALVARGAAEIAGASALTVLEKRTGDAQRGRSRVERLDASGRFVCDASIAGRRVTLFDDVCTTGATLRDCAGAVREAGGCVEDAVVVAATKSGQSWRPATIAS